MMNAIAALCGALFAAGVCISGMVRPSKVLGFLDFGGAWDATLAVVMASALAIQVIAWRLVARARAPRFGSAFPGPPASVIDLRLVGGAALFGLGWGIAGYCPGPAVVSLVSLVSLVSGARGSFVFVGAMAVAMLAYQRAAGADG
jgi:uncharacterized membrane protein YedE/YeeE